MKTLTKIGIASLLAGAFSLSGSMHVSALTDSGTTNVQGLVAGPPPSTPPTIENIPQKTTFSTKSIHLKGSCIADLIVKIYRNNIFAGSTLCQADGTYSLWIDLFVGKNVILSRQFDIAGQASPDSAPLIVFYAPKTPSPSLPDTPDDDEKDPNDTPQGSPLPTPPNDPNTPPQTAQFQLLIKYDYTLQAIFAHQAFHLPVSFTGGAAPYAVSINWGDGTNDVFSRGTAAPFTVDHVYQKAGYYTASVTVSDKRGEKASVQFVLLVSGEQERFLSNLPLLSHDTTWGRVTLVASAVLLLGLAFILGHRFGKVRAKKQQ